MKLREITCGKQLLVEGMDGVRFFEAFLRHLNRPDVQVQNFGGVDDLRAFLKAFASAPGFQTVVKALAIVRDAEIHADNALRSVQGAFTDVGLIPPPSPGTFTASRPRTGIFILPDAEHAGMLETLCLKSVAQDPAIPCVDEFIACIEQRCGYTPGSSTGDEKARVQAFLASRQKPGLRLGEAADKGYWPFDSEPLAVLRRFLLDL